MVEQAFKKYMDEQDQADSQELALNSGVSASVSVSEAGVQELIEQEEEQKQSEIRGNGAIICNSVRV